MVSGGGVPAGVEPTLSFSTDSLTDPRVTIGPADYVAVQLGVHASTGRVRACRVRLVAAAVEERERGVVVVAKDHFGFLRREAKDGQLFFLFGAISPAAGGGGGSGGGGGGGGGAVRTGDEFDFVVGVDERSGKQCATKLRPLARGTVAFETTLATALGGVVGAIHVAHGGGEVVGDAAWEGAAVRVPFSKHAVTPSISITSARGTDTSLPGAR